MVKFSHTHTHPHQYCEWLSPSSANCQMAVAQIAWAWNARERQRRNLLSSKPGLASLLISLDLRNHDEVKNSIRLTLRST